MLRSTFAVLALLSLSACGDAGGTDLDGGRDDGSPPDSGVLSAPATTTHCPGGPPPLADCAVGTTWARCGGTGDAPIFACTTGMCRWFEAGCVAAGFVPSPCAPEDLCCLPSGDEGFPFEPLPVGHPDGIGVTTFLTGFGTEPWTRERERNVVADTAALDPIDAVTIACDTSPARGPCDCPTAGLRSVREDVFIANVTPSCSAIGFWYLAIEVTRDADASLHGTVCRVRTTDYSINECPLAEPVCADAGTLTLSAFPESESAADSVRVDLSVTFPDGVSIDARL